MSETFSRWYVFATFFMNSAPGPGRWRDTAVLLLSIPSWGVANGILFSVVFFHFEWGLLSRYDSPM